MQQDKIYELEQRVSQFVKQQADVVMCGCGKNRHNHFIFDDKEYCEFYSYIETIEKHSSLSKSVEIVKRVTSVNKYH